MKWIDRFQLFLFDFDGLLVNTEHLHYQAYVNALANRGYDAGWNFAAFCERAHLSSDALREALCAKFPDLNSLWPLFYEEKKQRYFDLIVSGRVEMMPGAERMLKELEQRNIRRCVVTNSLHEQIVLIRSQIPILHSIPHWITREEYEKPKPDPECYLKAIALHGEPGDRIIGFEDSIRGLRALAQTPALPILICPSHHPLLSLNTAASLHFDSFESIEEID